MILRELRNQTQEHHSQVEKVLDLMNDRLTLDHYVWVLERLYGFYRPLERALERVEDLPTDALHMEARQNKSARILEDLRTIRGDAFDPSGIAECEDIPAVPSVPQGLGCLYVVEGATLGGRIITRHLSRTLQLSPETGAVFFSGYGARTETMWKEFQNYLLHCTASEAQSEIVATARTTFSKLLQWLSHSRSASTIPVGS